MYYIYIIYDIKNNLRKVSLTDNLISIKTIITSKSNLPLKLVYYETYDNKEDALKRRKLLNQATEKEIFDFVMENNPSLADLSLIINKKK